ncbi:MAG: DNA gyrase subunit A [Chloroflexi bacterium RBG_16_48_8]|nr:MAG: DNA gyrase subunit A [Chloroflexi bacterium RBG_16_48_8]
MEVGLVRRIDIDTEMQLSYLDYAMSVIVARALPDSRDGLKPVHRRILHAMHSMGIRSDASYKKSARIVGEVLGKYHPHGDMAVYDAMVRMAQDFSMRYQIVEGQGNFGSVDGDPPAAMRYTEARMSPLAMEILKDIDKNTVDFVDNFDGSLQEPTVLPAAVPNLLVNGATGIAVGMSTSIPPHNMREVCDALTFLLHNWSRIEQISLDDLMNFIKGPDFPTGGIIVREKADNGEGLRSAYGSGRGKITLQAKAHLEEMGRGRSRIIVTELPFQTNKSNLIERIAGLVRSGVLEGLADLRDESDRQGMRIVIELTKNADPEKVLTNLYRRTPMQATFSVIMLALVDGEPRLLSLKQALRVYLEHRMDVVRRRSRFELDRAKKRSHILEGLLVALKNLDEVIQIIRNSRDVEHAQDRLIKRFKLTVIQADAILEMPLRRLSGLERKKLDQEYREVLAKIKELESLLRSEVKIRNFIVQEISQIRTNYGDSRRTQIVSTKRDGRSISAPLTATDFASTKDTWIVITQNNLISRSPTQRLPRLAGRSAPKLVIGATGRDTLYLFEKTGPATALAIHTIPEAADPDEGIPIASVSAFSAETEITAGIALPQDLSEERLQETYLAFVTEKAMIKKTALQEFPGPLAKTFQAVKVAADDALMWVRFTTGKDDLLLVSRSGMAIRFSETDVRPMGLMAAGVNGMKLEDPQDRIVAADVFQKRGDIFILTDRGIAKRSAQSQFPRQGRYGKGVLVWKSGEVVKLAGAAIGLSDQRAIAFLKKAASRSVRLGDAVHRNRTASGNPLFPVKEDDQVLALSAVIQRPEMVQGESKGSSKKTTSQTGSPRVAKASTTSSRSTSTKKNTPQKPTHKKTSRRDRITKSGTTRRSGSNRTKSS